MKLIYTIILLFNFSFLYGQTKNIGQFSFYEDNTLHTSSVEGKVISLGENLKIKNSKKYTPSNYYTYSIMPHDVLEAISLSKDMVFYSALKSPNNVNLWVFIERNIENTSYNFCSFDFETKVKTILFSENESPDSKYAFTPFAWSKLNDEIYVQALVFGSATENEGIWSYNISTKKFTKLSVSKSYLTTPIISEDSKNLIYTGTFEKNKDMHSQANVVFVYDILKDNEIIVAKNANSSFFIDGWFDEDISNTDLMSIYENDPSLRKNSIENLRPSSVQQPSFKLPWPSGQTYCVTRTGIGSGFSYPSTCNSTTCGPYNTTPHDKTAIDFAIPQGVNILAAASGTVVFAWFNVSSDGSPGGFGNLVKIKHSDNTFSYYAHFNQIGVKVGDVVAQGYILGKCGTTGYSTGNHLHFEWRDVGEAIPRNNANWPIFSEYGCTPNQNKQYTSLNTQQTGTSNFSLNTSNALTIACNSSKNDATGGLASSINNTTSGDYSNVSTNPYTGWNDPGPEKVYKINVSSGATLTASLSNLASGLDLDVFILNSSGGNAGNVSVSSSSVTLTNATAGDYYILVDGAGSEYNANFPNESGNYGHYGSFTLTNTCSGGGGTPDLIVQNQQVTPSSVVMGQQVTASFVNKNQGTASAGASVTSLWLSANQTFDNSPTDIYITNISVPSLTAGQTSSTISQQITIPSGPFNGTWYVMFGADGSGVVSEVTNEGNNQVFVPVTFNTCTTPSAPTVTAASSVTQTSFQANWSAVASASYYLLDVSTNSSFTSYVSGYQNLQVSNTTANVSGVTCGITYYYRVKVYTCSVSAYSSNMSVPTSSCSGGTPANDNCSEATTLTVSGMCNYLTNQNTNNATAQFNAMACSGYTATTSNDVWYKFVANSTNQTIKVVGDVGFDAVLGLYSSCSSAGLIQCIDESGSGSEETLIITGLTVGNTYYIRVYNYGGQAGTFSICVVGSSSTSPPGNDNCSTAYTISPSTTCINIPANLNGATSSGKAKPACDGYSSPPMEDTWYKFTASTSGAYEIKTSPNFALDVVVSLYSSCSSAEIGCADASGTGGVESIYANLTTGNIYYLRFYKYGITTPSSTYFEFCIISPNTCSVPPVPSANPATNITQTSFTASWNSVSSATSYLLDVSTNSNFTSFISGYQGFDVGNVTSYNVSGFMCNPNFYYRVRAKNSCGESSNSNIASISGIVCNTVPANDNCATAQVLTVNTSTICTNTQWTVSGATPSGFLRINCDGASGGMNDVWFKFQVPIYGNYEIITTPSSGLNPVVALYRTSCTDNQLGCVSPRGSGVQIVDAGNYSPSDMNYYRIYGYGTNTTNDFNICVRFINALNPQGFTLSSPSNTCNTITNNITLQWSEARGASYYEIFNGNNSILQTTNTQATFVVTDNTPYSLTVRAINSNGFTLNSGGAVTITTRNCSCIDNPTLPTYNSGNVVQIKAPNTINATNRINAGANILYQAGRAVTLNSGFTIESGAVFKAQMGGCNN